MLVYLLVVFLWYEAFHRLPLAGALSWVCWACMRALALALLVLALMAPLAAAVASPLLATATGLFGLRVVLSKVGKHGRLPTRLYGIFARLGWPIQSAV